MTTRFFILCLGLLITSTLTAAQKPKLQEEKMKEMYKQGEFLPFKMKLPEGYVVMPLSRNGEWGLVSWQAVGEERTILDLWRQSDKNPKCTLNPLTGVIRMRFSDVVQKNENEFKLDDDEIIGGIKQMGGKNITIRSLKWGEYPVKVVQATLPNHPLAMGWIGLNTGGETVLINYLFPQNRPSYEKELKIWEDFINNTTSISQKELFDKMDKLAETMKKK